MKIDTACRRAAAITLALSLGLLTACGTGAAPAGSGGGSRAVSGISPELVAAAQAEGGVVLYAGGHQQQTLDLLRQRMQELFGIVLTFNRDDSGGIANSISAELASGAPNADVVSLTDPAVMNTWAAQGVVTGAEVTNLGGIVDGLDDPGTPQVPYGRVPLGIMYNAATTDPATLPRTWAELARTYPGTTVTADPNASGTALSAYTMIDAIDPAFVEGLAQRNTIVTESSLAIAQLVLTGEADIGIPAIESAVTSAAGAGEPLAIAYMQDGVPSYASELAVLARAPRPNAARLLVQYHLSPEFQADIAALGGRPVLAGSPPARGVPALRGADLRRTRIEEVGTRGKQVAGRFAQAFNR